MTMSSFVRFGGAAAIALIAMNPGVSPANAEDPPQAEIDAMRKGLAKYEDPYVAVRDLYLSTVGCVHYDGSTMEGHLNYAGPWAFTSSTSRSRGRPIR
jgi:hypothetical protein